MGSWSGSGLTGTGTAVTGATGAYTDVSVTVTDFGSKGRKIGPGPVYRARYVGSWALGCTPTDSWACNPAAVQAFETIGWESQDYNVQPRWGNVFGPSIMWILLPGVVVDMTVSW